MADNAQSIIAACESEWDTWKSDCSGFAKAVAGKLGIALTGQANDIVNSLRASPEWENLGAVPATATARATQGFFVVGGLKKNPNGHVVVVVKSASERHPVAYWGRLGGTGRKKTTVNWSWNQSDLPQVEYFATSL